MLSLVLQVSTTRLDQNFIKKYFKFKYFKESRIKVMFIQNIFIFMSILNSFYSKSLILLASLFLLNSCGDSGGQISKGHRDAIKIQCEDSSDPKACGIEVRKNFIEEGNEFVILEDGELDKDQIRKIKMECIRSKKFGLETYNNCLQEYKTAAINGTLFEKKFAAKPKSNIEDLEESVVYIEMVLTNYTKEQEMVYGTGSGVIINDKEIATNCHVAMAKADKKVLKYTKDELNWNINNDDLKELLWVKLLNGKNWAEAKLIKKNVNKDICILKHNPKDLFKISMKPIKKFTSFNKLKKGSFVRAMGSPGGLIGHTSTGDIQWLGTGEELDRNLGYTLLESFDKDTKFICHGAKVHSGSSGGPLFDKNGHIIGLNTLISDTACENIAVSSDHIKELIR